MKWAEKTWPGPWIELKLKTDQAEALTIELSGLYTQINLCCVSLANLAKMDLRENAM